MKIPILIADEMHPSLFPMLETAGFLFDYIPKIKRPELLEKIRHYGGLIIRSKTKIDKDFLDNAPLLKFIGRAGAGLDLIDLAEAAQRNIEVFAANEGNRDAVAEHSIGMLLTLLNKIHTADAEVRQGVWQREANRGTELGSKTIGIIGYGNNGRAFAQRLIGFNVRVLAYDKYLDDYGDRFAEAASMEQIFTEADILSLHIPLTDETYQLVNEPFVQQFKKSLYLLNISRGEIVVLKDLLEMLANGKILGACLDVLENEKLDQLNPEAHANFMRLIKLPNVVLTPHVAGWTHESYVRINELLVGKIKALQL